MGLDGTLILRAPSRRRQWRWWLPSHGDPASLAARLTVLASPKPPHGVASSLSLGDRLLACLKDAAVLDPIDPGLDPDRVAGACLRSELLLRRWHRGPLWIAVWRCHGDLGWQRRCGPMPLIDFLRHQRAARDAGRPESPLPLRQRSPDGPCG